MRNMAILQRLANISVSSAGYLPRAERSVTYGAFTKESGGVIVEYILVTTFTLAAGAATLNFLMKLMKEKMENLEQTIERPDESSWSDLLQNP